MNIFRKTTPNFAWGRRGHRPMAIVIHIMEGSLTGTDAWFADPVSKVSAHYGIGLKGQIHQYVDERDCAYHAGRVYAPTWSLIKKSKGNRYVNPNLYTIGIEHEGNENSAWTDEMYNASAGLINEISQRWGIPLDREHVIGHHEIYTLKTCPGNRVDIGKLINLALTGEPMPEAPINRISIPGQTITKVRLNMRKTPNTSLPPIETVPVNRAIKYDGYTDDGEQINGNGTWFFASANGGVEKWFWSGGVR